MKKQTQKEQALEKTLEKLLHGMKSLRPMLAFKDFEEARDFVACVGEAERTLQHFRER